MKIKTVRGLFKEGLENIIKNKVTSIVSITTMLVSLTMISLFYISIKTINENIDNMKNNIEIIAFIEEDLSENEISKLEAEIVRIDNIEKVEYISSEEALNKYRKELTEDNENEIIKILDDTLEENQNPIPASFNIKIDELANSEVLKERLLVFEEIYKVSDSNEVINFLTFAKDTFTKASAILMIILIVVSIVLISNSIKVAVFIRKKEISIIKYMGATNNFVRLPFLFEGITIGVISALMSNVITIGIYTLFNDKINSVIKNLITGFYIPKLSMFLPTVISVTLIIGVLVGAVASFTSVRKHLKV